MPPSQQPAFIDRMKRIDQHQRPADRHSRVGRTLAEAVDKGLFRSAVQAHFGEPRNELVDAAFGDHRGYLRDDREEQECGEYHQMHDALQHRGAAGAERDHADEQGQRQQHRILLTETEFQRLVDGDRYEGDRRNRRPMVASADPSARFRLVCSRLARAARSAASPSGNSTRAAMTMPTTAFGTAICASPASTVGVRNFARPTIATRDASRRPALVKATLLEGAAACSSLSSQEIVAVAHRLDENEGAVENERHDRGEDQLRRVENRAGRTGDHVRQDQRQRRQCGKDRKRCAGACD